MNIVEAVRKMKPNQKVRSKEAQGMLILDDAGYSLYYIDHSGTIGRQFSFNANEFRANDWEIVKDIEWVDFWTAWQARRKGKGIRSEFWHESVDLDQLIMFDKIRGFSEKEINGRWEIID